MVNEEKKRKAKLIIKVFLCANKGNFYSAKELANFINSNKLGMGQGVSSTGLSKIIDYDIKRQGILKDIIRKRKYNIWTYGVVD